MKGFLAILAVGLCGGAFYFIHINHVREEKNEERRLAQMEEDRRREEARLEALRQEDERIRKERMDALAKDDAVKMLQRYVTQEEESLKDAVEECKIRIEKVQLDQERLSNELLLLEKEEDAKATDAKRRKINRRDYKERIDAYFGSSVLNDLALCYLGEDFSAKRTEFRTHIGNLAKISDAKTRRYAENRKKYQQTIKDADENVNRLTEEASRRLKEARGKLDGNVVALRKKVGAIRSDISKLEKKESVTTLNMNEKKNLKELRDQLNVAEAMLTSAEATSGLGSANKAHLDVTMAETAARRAVDTAIAIRQDEDNAVEVESEREIAIYNAAMRYKSESVDLLQQAMRMSLRLQTEKMEVAERKLKYIKTSVANIDFLSADDIKALKGKVASRLADEMSFVVNDEVGTAKGVVE